MVSPLNLGERFRKNVYSLEIGFQEKTIHNLKYSSQIRKLLADAHDIISTLNALCKSGHDHYKVHWIPLN